MEGTTGPQPGTSARRRWLPLVLAAAGMAAFALAWLTASAPAPPAPPPSAQAEPQAFGPKGRAGGVTGAEPGPRPAERTADRLRGPHLPTSDPVSVRIPSLGLDTPLSRLGLAPDGTLETPRTAEEVGWFSGSATPGALGPAVIAGHVTWGGGPAVFHALAQLDRSDRVLVRRQDGQTAVFAVTDVMRFPKARFPTRAVYGATDHAAVRLITCGGRFDVVRGRYDDNVVVFGRLVDVRR